MTAGAESDVRWVVFEPHDTVTVRDGRPFDAGQQSMARMAHPSPTTVAGAVGRAFGVNPAEVHGPVVVRRRLLRQPRGRPPASTHKPCWEALLPVPADVVRSEDGQSWALLRPPDPTRPAPARTASSDLPHGIALLEGDGKPVAGWWTTGRLAAYLRDRAGVTTALGSSSDTLPAPAPWTRERRVGLARTPDRTASDGMLYSNEHLRLADGVGFAARCLAPAADFLALTVADAAVPTVRFGGEGRRAQFHLPVDGVPTLPDLPGTDFTDGRVLLYLATPALFGDGWRPDPSSLPPGVTLVAAAVAGPRIVSTASADHHTGAVGKTRLLWAAEAGSVYYLHIPDPTTARAFADACHNQLLVHTSPFPQIKDDIVTAGFGLALIGRW